MPNTIPDLNTIENLIKQIAQEEILPRFNHTTCQTKNDGSLVTEADLAADKRFLTSLAKLYPTIDFLSEEMPLAQQEALLQSSDNLWCLDPLDGTSNFAAGVPLFATSLALIQHGEVVLGCSYDPIRDEMFSAVKNQGAWLNGQPLRCKPVDATLDRTVAVVDFKRLTPDLALRILKNPPYSSQRNLGSSVLEWAWLTANRGHVYLHGGMKLWDLAAGSLILAEAGGHACTLEGEAVFKPAMEPRSVIISPDKQLFADWTTYLAATD